MLKRAIATILVLVMVIGLLPILPASTTAFAEDYGSCGENLTWSLVADSLYITGYGKMTDYDSGTNPAPWYDQRESIKKVFFTNSIGAVTKIGNFAFEGCVNLTDVSLPAAIESIGDFAFGGCEKLVNISLPYSVKTIGFYAFGGCQSLTKVPSEYRLEGVTSLATSAFQYCTGIEEAVIPPALEKIPSKLYYGCSGIKELIIPETVKTVGASAFGACEALTTVVLNTGVTELEEAAFADCSSLSRVFVSNPLKMGSGVFYNCPEDTAFYIEQSSSDFENYSAIDSDNTLFFEADHYYQQFSTVILNPNEGTGGAFGENSKPCFFEKKVGEDFTVSSDSNYIPCIEGAKFMGWNTEPDGSGTTFKPGDKYTGITTLNLYAQWGVTEIYRLSGSSRNGTAVAISEWVESVSDKCEAVVLANGWDFADALAGGPLAKAINAPILLITGDDNDEATFEEIERLGVDNVYILGGKVAVGKDVEDRLKDEGYIVKRIAGDSRFETAVKIAEEMENYSAEPSDYAFFAYSHNYPDALAVSGIAAMYGAPILYIGSEGVLDSATAAYVKKCRFNEARILGGTGAINGVAEGNIKNAGAKNVDRIAGATRYETCLEINKAFAGLFGDGTATSFACVSTGVNFPDALAGSVLAAHFNAPMLLVAPDEPLSAAQKEYFADSVYKEYAVIFIFGGKVALPEAIENEISSLLE